MTVPLKSDGIVTGITRRQFLKRSAAATGTVAWLTGLRPLDAGETDLPPTFHVFRNADQMSVEFRFLNFEVSGKVLRPTGGQRARIVVRFGPQHLGEAIFQQPKTVPETGELVSLEPELVVPNVYTMHPGAPVRSFLSGPSWLVFTYDEALGDLEMNPEKWLRWINDPRATLVVPPACLDPKLVQDPITGRVTPIPPRTDETAIEMPLRLFLAPSVPTQPLPALQRGLGREGGFNVLWHIALRSRVPLPPAAPPKDLPPEGLPPELQPPKRITLKARPFYSPDHLRNDEPPFESFFPDKVPLSLRQLTRHLLVEQIMGGDGIIDVERLELSPWGGNASFYYASQKGIDEIETAQMRDGFSLDGGPQAAKAGKPQTHLYLWKHRIVIGRDVFFAEAFFGWLFPFQHPAIYVEITERKFIHHKNKSGSESPNGAYLLKRAFIIRLRDLRRHLGSDSSLGREMALKQVRLITPQSPNLRQPEFDRLKEEQMDLSGVLDGNGNPIDFNRVKQALGGRGLYFFPVDLNNRPVKWELETEDESGKKQRTTEAQLFFASHLRVGRWLYSHLQKPLRSIPFPSVKVAFAPEAPVVRVPLPGGLPGITLPTAEAEKLAKFSAQRMLDQLREKAPATLAEARAALALLPKLVEQAEAWTDATKQELLEKLKEPLAELEQELQKPAAELAAWDRKLRGMLAWLSDPDVLQWEVEEAFRPLAEFVGKRVLEAAAVLENGEQQIKNAAAAAIKEAKDAAKAAEEKAVRWTEAQVGKFEAEFQQVLGRLSTEPAMLRKLAEEATAQLGKMRDLTSTLETKLVTFSSELLGREIPAAIETLKKVQALDARQFLEKFETGATLKTWVEAVLPPAKFEVSVRDRIHKRLAEARRALLGVEEQVGQALAEVRDRFLASVAALALANRAKLKALQQKLETDLTTWQQLLDLAEDSRLQTLVESVWSPNAALDAEGEAVLAALKAERDALRTRVVKLLDQLDSAKHEAEALGTRALQSVMSEAEVIIPALKGVAGETAAKAINFVEDYVVGSFDQAKNGAFAKLATGAIDEGKKLVQDVKNGLATPALIVAGVSREVGVIAGQTKDAINQYARKVHDLNLDEAIPDAKLFGCLQLKSLLQPLLRGKLPDWKTLELPDRIERTFAWLAPLKDLNLGIVKFQPKAACHFWLHARTTLLLRGQSPEGQVELIGWLGKWDAQKGKVGEDGSQSDGRVRLTPPDESFNLNLLGLIEVGFSQVDLHALYKTSEGLKKPAVKPTIGEVRFLGPLRFVQTLEEFLGDLFGGGFKIEFTGTHINLSLGFGLPPVSFGVFSLRNIVLWSGLGLPLGEKPLSFRFALSSFEKPFELSVMGFAGRGFFSVGFDTSGDRLLKGALEFGGALSFDVAVASGGLYVMAGIYYEGRTGSMLLSGYLRAGGNLNVLGLIHASVEFFLGLTFTEGGGQSELYGFCSVTVSIEFAFWSIDVSVEMEKHLAGSETRGNNSSRILRQQRRQELGFLLKAAAAEEKESAGEEPRPFIGGEDARFATYADFESEYWNYFFPAA